MNILNPNHIIYIVIVDAVIETLFEMTFSSYKDDESRFWWDRVNRIND